MLNTINIKIAGRIGKLCSKYRFSTKLYNDFRADEPSEFTITLEDMDIDFGNNINNNTARLRIKTPCILKKFSDALLDYDIMLMHGAVVAVNNKSYLFTAPSRTGKSTHIGLWLDHLPDAFIVNGDKPFIRFNTDGTILACGSPWAGKENMYTNTMVPLKSIILMERAEDNHIEQISFSEAFPLLFQQVYRPVDVKKMRKTLRLLQKLDPTVSFYRFKCNNFKNDCFNAVYDVIVGS